jgi:hypothetical protein
MRYGVEMCKEQTNKQTKQQESARVPARARARAHTQTHTTLAFASAERHGHPVCERIIAMLAFLALCLYSKLTVVIKSNTFLNYSKIIYVTNEEVLHSSLNFYISISGLITILYVSCFVIQICNCTSKSVIQLQ